MTTDPLAKHYETLSGAERFGLLIDAMSRNDKVEEGRVNDSCPMTAFKIEDPSYRGRVRQSAVLAMYVSLQIAEGLARIRTFHELLTDGAALDGVCADALRRGVLVRAGLRPVGGRGRRRHGAAGPGGGHQGD